MLKVKEWFVAVDAAVFLVTGYYLIDVFFLSFTLLKADDIGLETKNMLQLIVAVLAGCYWVFRISEWWANRGLRKENERIKNNILKNEEKLSKQKLFNSEMETVIKKTQR